MFFILCFFFLPMTSLGLFFLAYINHEYLQQISQKKYFLSFVLSLHLQPRFTSLKLEHPCSVFKKNKKPSSFSVICVSFYSFFVVVAAPTLVNHLIFWGKNAKIPASAALKYFWLRDFLCSSYTSAK